VPKRPGLTDNRARLPQVTKDATADDLRVTRGMSDAMAMRLANHNKQVHARYLPAGQQARSIYEAVEQARVESLGARAMPGMADNLDAMLQKRFADKITGPLQKREDAPLEDALALMVRERLTGQQPPESAQKAGRPVAARGSRRRPARRWTASMRSSTTSQRFRGSAATYLPTSTCPMNWATTRTKRRG
jgi:cobaltochelatase CobT subunit